MEILIGKKNLEVRPVSINKGEMVKKILSIYPESDFVLCCGDDKTDEDMFRSLSQIVNPSPRTSRSPSYSNSPQFGEMQKPSFDNIHLKHTYTVAVTSGTKYTNAQWRVDSSDDVVDLLGELAKI